MTITSEDVLMTEKEAWLMLAEKWREATPSRSGKFHVVVNGRWAGFLCHCLDALDFDLSEAMENRMAKHPAGRGLQGGFSWWDRDAAGAAARAEFCERMASLCDDDCK